MAGETYVPYSNLSLPIYAPGTFAGDLIRNAGIPVYNAIKDFGRWFLGPSPTFQPIGQPFLDSLFPGEPGFPRPELPFTGGQCDVIYTINAMVAGGAAGLVPTTFNRFGPVYGVSASAGSNGQITYFINTRLDNVSAGTAPPDYWENFGTPYITSVVPLSGGPDECGDTAPTFPPTIPTAGDLVVVAPVNVSPTLVVPAFFTLIKPTLDVDVDIPVQVDLRPTVQVGPFNIEIKFGPEGVTLQPYNPPGGTNPPPLPDTRNPSPPPSRPPAIPADCDCEPCDLTEVLELLNDIKECSCLPDTNLVPQTLGGGASGTFTLPSRTKAVKLTLVTIPANAKMEVGGLAPDVYYAGWASFGRFNGADIRTPISYAENLYATNLDYTSFSFTNRFGYESVVVAYREVDVP